MKNRVAFTLPQLLVIVAVGSLLAVAILPTLQSDHATLQRAICANNLRQIGVAITMYAEDNNDSFPLGYEQSPGSDWQLMITPYLGKTQTSYASNGTQSPVFICPAAVLVLPAGITVSLTYTAHRWMFVDQATIAAGSCGQPPPNLPCRYLRSQVVRPGEVVMVFDGCQQSVDSATTFDAQACSDQLTDTRIAYPGPGPNQPEPINPPNNPLLNTDGPNSVGFIRWRHYNNNGANFLFVDGHVSSLLVGQLLRRNLRPDVTVPQ
jgi:prepilin-type processing-associated H-X9-DG protein